MATNVRRRGWRWHGEATTPYLSAYSGNLEALRLTPSTTGVDVRLLGDTPASNYINFDASACTLDMVNTISGSSAQDGMSVTVTDTTTNSSGYTRGFYVNTTASGTKTSSGEHNALGVDMAISGDTPYAYIESIYMSTSGNPTIGLSCGISIYMDNQGTGLASQHILDLQTGNPTASAASTREAYIRFRNHGTGTPTSVMFLQANNNASVATNFIETGGNNETGPVAASTTAITSGTNSTYRIRCLYGSTTFYLIGVAAA